MPGANWKLSSVSKSQWQRNNHIFDRYSRLSPGPLAAERYGSLISLLLCLPALYKLCSGTFQGTGHPVSLLLMFPTKLLRSLLLPYVTTQLPPPNPQTAADLMEEESKRLRAQTAIFYLFIYLSSSGKVSTAGLYQGYSLGYF